MLSKKKKSRIKECSNSIHKKGCIYNTVGLLNTFSLLLLGCSLLNPAGFGIDISNGRNDSLGSIGSSNKAYADSNEEEGISTLANGDNISLSISGDVNAAVTAGTDKPVFRSHTVTASASNIESYSLTIKYDTGSTSLKNSTTSATVIKDLSTNTVGSNIPDNTWGWGWSDSTTTADTAMTYQAMSTSDKVIKSSTNPTNNAANISGKLAFGAKFADGATAGHYQANVLVSFAIKPQEVATIPFNGITTMQEMTSSICSGASVGTTGRLLDTRDNKLYWVVRTSDGYYNCWMTQNLDYDGGGTKMASASITGNTAQYYDPGEKYCYDNSCDHETTNNDGHDAIGNYYNWFAAVNGSGVSTTDGKDAEDSVCPKGWFLPTKNGTFQGSFGALMGKLTVADITASPYYYVMAGQISNIPSNVGTGGYYWTSNVYNAEAGTARALSFTNTALNTNSIGGRTVGYSVRCAANVCQTKVSGGWCEPDVE